MDTQITQTPTFKTVVQKNADKLFSYNNMVVELKNNESEIVLLCYELDKNKDVSEVCELFSLNKVTFKKMLTGEVTNIYSICKEEFCVSSVFESVNMNFEAYAGFKLQSILNLKLTPIHLSQFPLLYKSMSTERKMWDIVSDILLKEVSSIVYRFIKETVDGIVTDLEAKEAESKKVI